MSEIFNPNYNDLPTQVEVNKRDIEELQALIKQPYNTTQEYGDSEEYPILTVELTTTNIPLDTDVGAFSGYLITKDSILLSIINIAYANVNEEQTKVVNASYVCSLRGPKGDTGATGATGQQGPQGEKGDAGDQLYVSTYVPSSQSSVGSIVNIPWSSTNVPQPSGDEVVVPDSVIFVGDGWLYHLDGYIASGDITGYSLVCMAIADLKGQSGTDGITPNITMQASVTNTVGTPVVTVYKQGTDTNPQFTLAFENLKGDSGPQGEKGDDAVTLSIGSVSEGSPASASLTSDGNGNYTLDLVIPSGGGGGSDVNALQKIWTNNNSKTMTYHAFYGGGVRPTNTTLYGKPAKFNDKVNYNFSDLISKAYEGPDFHMGNLFSDGYNLFYFNYGDIGETDPDTGDPIISHFYYIFDQYTTGQWIDISNYQTNTGQSLSDYNLNGENFFSVGNGKFVYLNPNGTSYCLEPQACFDLDGNLRTIFGLVDCSIDNSLANLQGTLDANRIVQFNDETYYIDDNFHIHKVWLTYDPQQSIPYTLHFGSNLSGIYFGGYNLQPGKFINYNGNAYCFDPGFNMFKISNDRSNNYPANTLSIYAYYTDDQTIYGAEIKRIDSFFQCNGRLYLIGNIGYSLAGDGSTVSFDKIVEVVDDMNGNIVLYPISIMIPTTDYGGQDGSLFETWTSSLPTTPGETLFTLKGITYNLFDTLTQPEVYYLENIND